MEMSKDKSLSSVQKALNAVARQQGGTNPDDACKKARQQAPKKTASSDVVEPTRDELNNYWM